LLLYLFEPLSHGRAPRHPDAPWDRVDAEAEHLVDSRKLGRPPGNGDAEENVVATAVSREQQSPGCLKRRAQRDVAFARPATKVGRLLARELDHMLAMKRSLSLRFAMHGAGKRSRFLDASQLGAPKLCCVEVRAPL
jgi:hypothetical protein